MITGSERDKCKRASIRLWRSSPIISRRRSWASTVPNVSSSFVVYKMKTNILFSVMYNRYSILDNNNNKQYGVQN